MQTVHSSTMDSFLKDGSRIPRQYGSIPKQNTLDIVLSSPPINTLLGDAYGYDAVSDSNDLRRSSSLMDSRSSRKHGKCTIEVCLPSKSIQSLLGSMYGTPLHGDDAVELCPLENPESAQKKAVHQHEEIQWKCAHCGKHFEQRLTLNYHQFLMHDGAMPHRWPCITCGETFTTAENLVSHLKLGLHTRETSFEESFTGVQTLTGHMRKGLHTREKPFPEITDGRKPYKRTECEESFTGAQTLAGQMRIGLHTRQTSFLVITDDRKPYKKTKCEESFTGAQTLAGHMRIDLHTREKPVPEKKENAMCITGQKSFPIALAANHIRTHMEKSLPTITAKPVGTTYKTPAALHVDHDVVELYPLDFPGASEKKAVDQHTGEKPFTKREASGKPTACAKSETPTTARNLVGHLRLGLHTRQKSLLRVTYDGKTGEESFTGVQTLAGHMRIGLHTREKPFPEITDDRKLYKRTKCVESNTGVQTLAGHMRMGLHTREKRLPEKGENAMCTTGQKSLAGHMRIGLQHTREKPVLKIADDIKPYKRTKCEESFTGAQTLAGHMRIGLRTSEKPSPEKRGNAMCTTGQKSFPIALAANHIRTHTVEKSFPTITGMPVGSTCKTPAALHVDHDVVELFPLDFPGDTEKKAVDQQTEEKPLTKREAFGKPTTCAKSVTTAQTLPGHTDTRKGDKPIPKLTDNGETKWECMYCEKSFDMRCRLKFHMHTHTKPFKCTLCDKRYARKEHLRQHKDSAHDGAKPYKCAVCDASLCTAQVLAGHMTIHTGEKPYKCRYCDKHFSRTTGRSHHERKVHTGNPYQCSFCGKSFLKAGQLKRHEAEHNEEKTFKCGSCEKCFAHPNSLKAHEKNHLKKERNIMCAECGRCFSSNTVLAGHMRTHTREKPFKCAHCEKSFSCISNQQKHERIHTGAKPFKCRTCEKAFSCSSNRRKHEAGHVQK